MFLKPKNPTRTNHTDLRIPTGLQQLFVAVIALSWVFNTALLIYQFTGVRGLFSGGTWVFQATVLFYPLLCMAIAIFFVARLRTYKTWLARCFVAGVIGITGLAAYEVFGVIWRIYRTNINWQMSQGNDNLWVAFGDEWIVMTVTLALYIAVLGLADKRWRSKQ